MFSIPTILKNGKIIPIILVWMTIFWLLTYYTMNITAFKPDSFFYIENLPIFYWIGIIFGCYVLGILILKSDEILHKTVFELILTILFVLYLFGTPVFVYASPQFIDTYGVINRVSDTILNGHILALGGYDIEYPLQIVFFSQLAIISMSIFQLAKIFPLINVFIVSLFIYLLAKKINPKYCIIAPIFYLTISWLDIQHLSPQSYGLMLTVMFLYFLITRFIEKTNIVKTLFLFLIMIVIVFSHPISPLLNFMPLLIIWIVTLLLSYSKLSSKFNFIKRDKIINILILQGVFYFGYSMYLVEGIFGRFLQDLNRSLMNFLYGGKSLSIVDFTITKPMFSYMMTYYLREISLILIALLGLLAIIIILSKKRDKIGILLSCIFFGYMSIFGYLFLTGTSGFVDRGFAFALMILPLLVVSILGYHDKEYSFKIFNIFFIVLFIFSLVTFPITNQGTAPYMVPSTSEIAASDFIYSNPQLEQDVKYSYSGSPAVYNQYWFNYITLKHQKGQDYINSFNLIGLNKIYDSGQAKIYNTKDYKLFNQLQNGAWNYTGYRSA